MRLNRVVLITELARRDMSLKRLAELTGISRVTLTAVKSGKACSADTGERIATALGVNIKRLLDCEVRQ